MPSRQGIPMLYKFVQSKNAARHYDHYFKRVGKSGKKHWVLQKKKVF
jgi:hypothetical protein